MSDHDSHFSDKISVKQRPDGKKAALAVALMLSASGTTANAEAYSSSVEARNPILKSLIDESRAKHTQPKVYAQYTYCNYNFCNYAKNFGNYGRDYKNPLIELRKNGQSPVVDIQCGERLPNGSPVPAGVEDLLTQLSGRNSKA
jgi:hypothetical protein